MNDTTHKGNSIDSLIGIRNQVTDTSIKTGIWISTVVGAAVVILFCVLQRTSLLYRYRLVANHVRVKPPELAQHGLLTLVDWAIKALMTSDLDFVQSAGLDALIMVKLCALGVQLFLPPCILGSAVLIPLHWTGGESVTISAYHSGFMRLTMSNIRPGSPVFWVHLALVYMYMWWAMTLLRWHYHQYLTIRQHYVRKGDDVNHWRSLYDHTSTPFAHFLRNLPLINGQFLRNLPLINALVPSEISVANESSQSNANAGSDDQEEQLRTSATIRRAMLRRYSPGRAQSLRNRRRGASFAIRDPKRSSIGDALPDGAADTTMQSPFARKSAPLDQAAQHRSRDGALPDAYAKLAHTGGQPSSSLPHRQEPWPSASSHLIALAENMPRTRFPTLESHEVHEVTPASGAEPSSPSYMTQAHAVVIRPAAGEPNGESLADRSREGAPVAESTEIECVDQKAASVSDAGPPAWEGSRSGAASSAGVRLQVDDDARAGREVAGQNGHEDTSARRRAGDVEAGLGTSPASSFRAASVVAPPSKLSMSRPDTLCPDAHLLEWWSYVTQQSCDELGVSRSRPSVSHCKTVNAAYPNGTERAVLAQHYAVLVMDVAEPKLRVTGNVKAAADDSPTKDESMRKWLASFIPLCIRSWCNMKYGTRAARKMNEETLSGGPSFMSQHGAGDMTARPSQVRVTSSLPRPPYPSLMARIGLSAVNLDGRPTLLAEMASRHRRIGSMEGADTQQARPGLKNGASQRSSSSHGAISGGGANGDGPEQPQPASQIGSQEKFTRTLKLLAKEAVIKPAVLHRERGHGPNLSQAPSSNALSDAGDDGVRGEHSANTRAPALLPTKLRITESDVVNHNRGSSGGGSPPARTRFASPAEGNALVGRSAGPVAESNESVDDSGQEGKPARVIQMGSDSQQPAQPALASPELHVTSPEARDAGASADKSAEAESAAGDADPANVASCVACNWGKVREAVWRGRIALLPGRKCYSIVSATFMQLFPEEFDRAIRVINHKEVDLLLMRVDQHMAQYEYAVKYEEKNGKELYSRIGCCGLTGERRRLRDYHMQRVNELMAEVKVARRRAFEEAQTSSWFVFFRTQRAAAIAAQCVIHSEDNRQFRVHPAPGPEEVNWPALWSDYTSRDLRRMLMRPLVALVVSFPIGIFTGGLMQLDYLLCPEHACLKLDQSSAEWVASNCSQVIKEETRQLQWKWYCSQDDAIAKLLKRLVVGWLPSLLITLWQGMVLPLVFMFIVQTGREAVSLSQVDRIIAKYMFYFGIFNVFLGGVVGSTIIQGINSAIERGPSEIFNLIGTYVPTSSNFFINYTMFRALVAMPLRMLWPHIGIRMYLLRRYLRFSCIITQREKALLMAPVSPRYGFEVGMVMLVFVIAFAFSVVSPLLLPMTLLFFGMAWLFWRWALLYVYVRKYEGGGTMWPFIFSCLLVCMGIFPLFTACVFVTKQAYAQAILLLITVPIILYRFNSYIYYRFQNGMDFMPLEFAATAPIACVDPWVYTPPPLLPKLLGWHPDWSKCWQGWNLPVMYR